jgi:hypothetical protein
MPEQLWMEPLLIIGEDGSTVATTNDTLTLNASTIRFQN